MLELESEVNELRDQLEKANSTIRGRDELLKKRDVTITKLNDTVRKCNEERQRPYIDGVVEFKLRSRQHEPHRSASVEQLSKAQSTEIRIMDSPETSVERDHQMSYHNMTTLVSMPVEKVQKKKVSSLLERINPKSNTRLIKYLPNKLGN